MRLLAILLVLVVAVPARAGLKAKVSASMEVTSQGRELVFRGTLSNTSSTTKIYLNDIAAASNENLVFRSNSFFSNVPGLLLPGESYTDSELFRLVLIEPAPKGDFEAIITVKGGNTIFANDDLALVSCRILVPAAEPSANRRAVYTLSLGRSVDSRLVILAGELGLSFVPSLSDRSDLPEASTDLVLWKPAESVTEPSPNLSSLLSYRYKIPIEFDRAFIRLRLEQD